MHDEVLDVLVYGSFGAFKVKVKSTSLQTRHSLERWYIEMKSKVAYKNYKEALHNLISVISYL